MRSPAKLFAPVLALLLLGSACARRPDGAVLQYLRLAAALGERDPDAVDYYYGPEEWTRDVRAHPPTLAEIRRAALDLARQLESARAPNDFLIKQLKSIAARASIAAGARLSFVEEARALFDTGLPPGNPEAFERIRREIDSLLPGPGSLAQRYAGFDRRFMVPPERVPAVFDRAVKGCRERTLEHWNLPATEKVTSEFTGNQPWNAYSSYQGHFQTRIRVNADFPLTVDRAFNLACHEGYPGHHALNVLTDQQLVQREHRFELLVQPTFSPQSFVSEALASYAPAVAFPDNDHDAFERGVLFPLAGIDERDAALYTRVNLLVDRLQSAQVEIAEKYADGSLEWSRAASALEDQVLMTHAEATLKYLNQYRTYMLTYTEGKEMVKACFSRRPGQDRWKLFQELALGRVNLSECASGK